MKPFEDYDTVVMACRCLQPVTVDTDKEAALGVEYQAENVEELLSEIGIMMLMHTGGFNFTEDAIKKVCAKYELGDSICEMCIEFFVKRYTFSAWR